MWHEELQHYESKIYKFLCDVCGFAGKEYMNRRDTSVLVVGNILLIEQKCTIPNRKVRRKENIPIRKRKICIPMRKRKIFQLEKGKYSNQKKENIPIRKRKPFQLEK